MKDAFYANLAELLEVDSVDPDLPLDHYDNWDSLTALALIAWLDKELGVAISAKGISEFACAADLFAALEKQHA
ncbi:acyl carrier protein [Caballeronia sp. GAWG1-1]|uniref:acyl carrier protein n=1 Tax=Caballeronia sp. GAWG1-1 TaxID=2921742 RepID=UPI0020281454|nr:acyl carrier protein [Caballeronia sp. GAWG1-1]